VLDNELSKQIYKVERENKSLTHNIESKIGDLERLQQEFTLMKQYINNDLLGNSKKGIEFTHLRKENKENQSSSPEQVENRKKNKNLELNDTIGNLEEHDSLSFSNSNEKKINTKSKSKKEKEKDKNHYSKNLASIQEIKENEGDQCYEENLNKKEEVVNPNEIPSTDHKNLVDPIKTVKK